MKFITGLIVAVLLTVVSVSSMAQNYCITNNTPATITVYVQRTCGTWGISLLPFATACTAMPPGCSATGVVYNGTYYPIGYSGPLPPPNPPNSMRVGLRSTTFF